MKRRLLALLLMLLLLPQGRAMAAEEGSIAVQFASVGGAAFRLYRVGEVEESGALLLSGAFADYAVALDAQDSAAWRAAAQALAGYAARDALTPLQVEKTDKSGRAVFSGLSRGIYLIVGERSTSGNTVYEPAPLLVFLPFVGEDGGWEMAAAVNCKYESETKPGPGETVDRHVLKVWRDGDGSGRPARIEVQLLRDGRVYDTVVLSAENNWRYTWEDLSAEHAWSVVEKAVPEGYAVSVGREGITFVVTNSRPYEEPEEPGGGGGGGKLPQTGALWWPVPLLLCGGALLLVLGIGRRRRAR